MKKLTIEEKAKEFDEAFDRARQIYDADKVSGIELTICEKIFPEIKDSEDERIRKRLISYFKSQVEAYKDGDMEVLCTYNKWISWLEKQGEKAEPIEDFDTEFERQISHLVASAINREHEYNKGYIKWAAQSLIEYAKREIEKQGEQKLNPVLGIEIPFGAKDSELQEASYYIPEGFHAEIDGNRVVIKQCSQIPANSAKTCKDKQKPIKKHDACDFCEDKYGCVSHCPTKLIEEEKPADKVEPKFKVGDWIIGRATNNEPRQISEITDQYYKSTYGGQYGFSFEDGLHFWTIQDAKDGDILATPIDVLIFKNHLPKNGGVSYCHYTSDSKWDQFNYNENNNWYFGKEAIIHPATKEQCDTLFAKMKEAGYEWDAEKKELKRIIDEKQIKKNLQDNSFRRMFEQKPAWDEEDEKIFDRICDLIHSAAYANYDVDEDGNECGEYANIKGWFKKLKNRVQPQLKKEWSEEDETNASYICAALDCYYRIHEERNNTNGQEDLDKARNWLYNRLKSIRPLDTWKPSDLPHWKKSTLPDSNTTGFNSDYFCHKGYCINYKELFEKLPKDD